MARRMRYHKSETLMSGGYCRQAAHPGIPDSDGNLVASLTMEGTGHMPILDLDIPHQYVRSQTEGHGHLYLDVEISWWRYKRMLKQLYKAGVIERGFYLLAKKRRMTMTRAPETVEEKRQKLLWDDTESVE